jgi:acetyltransferase-like isoleucine patch superfamily enzyme
MNCRKITVGNITLMEIDGAWIAEDTVLGNNVVIFPGTVLGRPPVSTKFQIKKTEGVSLPPVIIGDNCVIGANVVIYRGTIIGDDCLIGDTACIREQVRIGSSCIIAMGVTINYNTTIGCRVKVMDNTHLTGNMTIEDDVFIAMHVSTANDNSMGREAALNVPLSLRKRQGPVIRRHATIGQGTCILPGIELGENSIIGANSVVTKPIPAHVLALGSPARVVRELREDEIKK